MKARIDAFPPSMNLSSNVFLAMVLLVPGFAAADEPFVSYSDKATGFGVHRPAGWEVSKEVVPAGTVTTFINGKTSTSGCLIASYRVPLHGKDNALHILLEKAPMKGSAWEVILDAQGYKAVKIVSVTAGQLAGHPANKLDFFGLSPLGDKKLFARAMMIAAPIEKKLWKIDCFGIGNTRELAEKSFEDAASSIRQIQESFRSE